MKVATALLAVLALYPMAALADDEVPPVSGGRTWTQHLVTIAKARHAGVLAIVADGTREGDKAPVVLGSTLGAAQVFSPARAGSDGARVVGNRYVVRLPYETSTHHRLGTVQTSFDWRKDADTARLRATAAAIARDLSHDVLSAKNAADPYPWDPRFGPNTRAQQLTEEIVGRNPDILVVMLHATPPGEKTNVVIGSNIGRFGKAADEDDLRIINTGATNLEVAGQGDDRYETALPLNDAAGKQIGAIGIVFHLAPGGDKDALHARGRAIRDALAHQIPDNATLFAPRR